MTVAVSDAASAVHRKKFALVLLLLQIVFVVLFSVFAKYADDPKLPSPIAGANAAANWRFPGTSFEKIYCSG